MSGGTLPPPAPGQRPAVTVAGPPWRWIGLGGAVALALGSVLPWASIQTAFGSVSVNGTDGDGALTLACGVLAIIGFAVQKPLLAIIPAGIGLAIGLYDLININRNISNVDTEFARSSVGFGLWVLVAGGIVAVISAFMLIAQKRARSGHAAARAVRPTGPAR
ncbi:MAG: hypothetical protein ACRDZ2_11960 [Ilumatobacteraceae bacterium]